jgi:nucleoside-diphosphate-sugar epimerase
VITRLDISGESSVAGVTKLVVGAGYLGARVAAYWQRHGARVRVTTRNAARAESLASEGFDAHVLDVTRPQTLVSLPPVDTVLYCVAYDPRGDVGREEVAVGGLNNLLDAVPRITDRLIYISTTGVYGQHDDEWVDERSATNPSRAGGQCHLAAEQLLQGHRWAARSVVLRMAGIYGPGRIPYLDLLRAGHPLPVDPTGFLNLIHVDDAVQVIAASERATLPNVFVVSDGAPVQRREYYREVARWVGCEPKFCEPDPASAQAQRAQASKRIRADKLQTELRVALKYPSYREGLAAILGGTAG